MNKIETTETFENGTEGCFSLTLLEFNSNFNQVRIESSVKRDVKTTTYFLRHYDLLCLTKFYTMYGVNKQLSEFSKKYREKIKKLPRI